MRVILDVHMSVCVRGVKWYVGVVGKKGRGMVIWWGSGCFISEENKIEKKWKRRMKRGFMCSSDTTFDGHHNGSAAADRAHMVQCS